MNPTKNIPNQTPSPKSFLLAVNSPVAGITDYLSPQAAYNKYPQAFHALYRQMQEVLQRAQAKERKRQAIEERKNIKQQKLI